MISDSIKKIEELLSKLEEHDACAEQARELRLELADVYTKLRYGDNGKREGKAVIDTNNVEELFEEAIKNEEFKVFYQPKVNLKTYEPTGAEALCPGLPIVYAGGVMSNSFLQSRLGKRKESYFAAPEFSADNAAGIALLCRKAYLKEQAN